MIKSNPDVVVARVLALVTPQETITVNSSETKPHTQKGRLPDTKDFTTDNLVEKHYRFWASSSFWLIFLLCSFEYRKRCCKKGEVIEARFRVPTWISNMVLECSSHKTLSGWQLNFQTYRVLAFEHPLFRCARSGNVKGIQDLLSRREICVTDRQIWTGSTALHVSFVQCSSNEYCSLNLLVLDRSVPGTS